VIIDAITETGSRYRIDFDTMLWQKISWTGVSVATEKLWDLQTGTELAWPWDAPDSWEKATRPEVGKHLFVSGKDRWYASTKIVKVVETDNWKD
jgi:hypothetical protein